MTEAEASSLEMLRKQMQYPLIKARALTCGATPRLAAPSITVRCARQNCDMPEEMRQDCVDLVITAIERFAGTPQSYEARSSAHAYERIPRLLCVDICMRISPAANLVCAPLEGRKQTRHTLALPPAHDTASPCASLPL